MNTTRNKCASVFFIPHRQLRGKKPGFCLVAAENRGSRRDGEIETICQQLCFQHHNLLPLDSGHFILVVEKRLTLQNFDCCEITAGKLTLDAHVSQIFS